MCMHIWRENTYALENSRQEGHDMKEPEIDQWEGEGRMDCPEKWLESWGANPEGQTEALMCTGASLKTFFLLKWHILLVTTKWTDF